MAKKSFSELISSPGMPVLVDFYADWCGPCKTMSPILSQVASELSGKVKVIKVDVVKNPAAANQFQVQGIPTLILFSKGKPIFVPFYTTKKSGSGIGLSLSRQIMRLHQGSLQVHSEPGNTVFSLVFNN